MTLEEQILEILIGRKVKTADGKWHVYNEAGVEISDPGGVLWRGNVGALLMWPNEPIEQWLTEQGVARNLAEKLRLRQDCWVRVRCEPVPAGSDCDATVTTDVLVEPTGSGSTCGCDVVVDVCGISCVSPAGSGLRVGGGRPRVKTSSCAVSVRVPAFSTATPCGSDAHAYARGIHNPTDEQLMVTALMAIRRRRLTTPSSRV